MNEAVLDASIIGRWFWQVGDPATAALRRDFEAGRLGITVPSLLFLELLNVAGRQLRWGAELLEEFADRLGRIEFQVLDPELGAVALWVARGLTAYDASYVALAEQLAVSLITDDRAVVELAPRIARRPG